MRSSRRRLSRRSLDVVSVTSAEAGPRGVAGRCRSRRFDAAVFYCTLERLSRSGGECSEHLKRALSPGRRRHGHCAHDRQPDGAAVPVGLVGVQLQEPSLLLGGHAAESAHQERLRRSDHRRATTARSLSSTSAPRFRRSRQRSTGVSLRLLVWATPAIPAAPRVPLVEQQTGRSSPASKPVAASPTLSVIVPAYNEKATFSHAHGPAACQVDRRAWTSRSCWSRATRRTARARRPSATARIPRVRLILQDRPRGKGHAVRAGPGRVHRRRRAVSGCRPGVRHRRLRRSHRAAAGLSAEFRDRLPARVEGASVEDPAVQRRGCRSPLSSISATSSSSGCSTSSTGSA